MKLRNKKTGGIWNIPKMRHPTIQEDGISFFAHNRDKGCLFSYKSIAELNNEWEDYEPVEPIIEGPKALAVLNAYGGCDKCNRLLLKEIEEIRKNVRG